MQRERKIYIDFLRCVACFLVIVNHTVSTELTYHQMGFSRMLLTAYFFLSKIAVPCFVMITGVVLLHRDELYSTVYKRIWRIFLVLCFSSVLYHLSYFGLRDGVIQSTKTIILNVFQDGISNEFWYLYMYIGLLFMMPLLRKMRSNMNEMDYRYLFIFALLVHGVYPLAVKTLPALGTIADVNFSLFDSFIAFMFWGDYVERFDKFRERKYDYYTIIAIVLSIGICTFLTTLSYKNNDPNYLWLDNVKLVTTAIPACCFFVLVRNHFAGAKPDWKLGGVISNIGKCTFGMYIISDVLIYRLKFIYIWMRGTVSGIPALILFEILIFITCYLLVKVIRKNKFVRKII